MQHNQERKDRIVSKPREVEGFDAGENKQKDLICNLKII